MNCFLRLPLSVKVPLQMSHAQGFLHALKPLCTLMFICKRRVTNITLKNTKTNFLICKNNSFFFIIVSIYANLNNSHTLGAHFCFVAQENPDVANFHYPLNKTAQTD